MTHSAREYILLLTKEAPAEETGLIEAARLVGNTVVQLIEPARPEGIAPLGVRVVILPASSPGG